MTIHFSESGARRAYKSLAGDRPGRWISLYAIARRTAPTRRDTDVLKVFPAVRATFEAMARRDPNVQLAKANGQNMVRIRGGSPR